MGHSSPKEAGLGIFTIAVFHCDEHVNFCNEVFTVEVRNMTSSTANFLMSHMGRSKVVVALLTRISYNF